MTTTWEQQARRLDADGKLVWMVKCGVNHENLIVMGSGQSFVTRNQLAERCKKCNGTGLVPAPFSEGLVMDGLRQIGYDHWSFGSFGIDPEELWCAEIYGGDEEHLIQALLGFGPTRKDAMCAALGQLAVTP